MPEEKPLAFEYFEVRPCIEHNRNVTSYQREEDFEAELSTWRDGRTAFSVFWTLYGIDDGNAVAIGDFKDRTTAHAVMNAILAPMARARDTLNAGLLINVPREVLFSRIRDSSSILEDFIYQCSNEERV